VKVINRSFLPRRKPNSQLSRDILNLQTLSWNGQTKNTAQSPSFASSESATPCSSPWTSWTYLHCLKPIFSEGMRTSTNCSCTRRSSSNAIPNPSFQSCLPRELPIRLESTRAWAREVRHSRWCEVLTLSSVPRVIGGDNLASSIIFFSAAKMIYHICAYNVL
jgi:hypothetical protein